MGCCLNFASEEQSALKTVRSAWTGVPASASLRAGAGGSLASPVASLLYKKITSGMEVRRTPDVKLMLVGFIRFVSLNFGHVQLLRFVAFIFIRAF